MLSVTSLRFNVYGALGKEKYSEESVSLCELSHHKRQKEWPRLEPKSPGVSTTCQVPLLQSCTHLTSVPRVLHVCAHLILLPMVILTTSGDEYKLRSFSLTVCFDTSGLPFSWVLFLFLKISRLLSTFHHAASIKYILL